MARHFKATGRHFAVGVLDHITPAAGSVLVGTKTWEPHGLDGTYSPGAGYTYGDNNAAQVLSTATGAGSYHAPDAAEVISTASFGPNSGTAGTYDVSNVSAGNIKTGVSIGGVTGTFTNTTDYVAKTDVVAAANVRFGTTRYTGGGTGTCYVPAAADVQFGVSVDATTGTFVVPAVTDVSVGVGYGAAGTEFVGTLVGGGGTFPAAVSTEGDIYTTL